MTTVFDAVAFVADNFAVSPDEFAELGISQSAVKGLMSRHLIVRSDVNGRDTVYQVMDDMQSATDDDLRDYIRQHGADPDEELTAATAAPTRAPAPKTGRMIGVSVSLLVRNRTPYVPNVDVAVTQEDGRAWARVVDPRQTPQAGHVIKAMLAAAGYDVQVQGTYRSNPTDLIVTPQ